MTAHAPIGAWVILWLPAVFFAMLLGARVQLYIISPNKINSEQLQVAAFLLGAVLAIAAMLAMIRGAA